MTTATVLITCICAALCLVIVALIGTTWRDLSSLHQAADSPASPDSMNPFRGNSSLLVLAGDFADGLTAAASAGALQVFNVNTRAAALRNRIAGRTGVVRALVGVLILGGLLVTLFNLQDAVQTLGQAFDALSRQQASATVSINGSVSLIQASMSGIAGSAHRAFLFSAIIISLAVLSLIATTALQRRAVLAVNAFLRWADQAYLVTWRQQRPTDETSKIQELGNVIARMDTVVSVLASLGQSMNSVSDLGIRLEESTSLISKAIDRLPENVRASVSQLSNEVASQISDDLQHHTHNITRILAIYTEQEVRIKMIHDTLRTCEQHILTSASALSSLAPLPQKLDLLTKAIERVDVSSMKVSQSVGLLDAKIAALPLVDLQRAASSIETGMVTLHGLGQQILSLTNGIEALMSDYRKILAGITPEVAREVGQRLESPLAELMRAVRNADTARIQQATDLLLQNSVTISAKLDKNLEMNDFLGRMESELRLIHKVVNEPLWRRFTAHKV